MVTEFGRTPDMNPHGGRDHYIETYPMMLMGGGVKGGRVLGKTDETGGKVIDTGWNYREQTMMDHMTSTIHSAWAPITAASSKTRLPDVPMSINRPLHWVGLGLSR